jgi:hypothetical protein
MNAQTHAALATLALAGAALAGGTRVTFDNGNEGWTIQNFATITPDGGNPGPYLSHFQIDTFGINISNTSTRDFLGDYGAKGPVRVGLDILVNRVWDDFIGDLSRDIVVELRDYDNPPEGYPWVSVWYNLGTLSTGQPWHTLSVDIQDPTQTALPPGWGGYGAEDPNTFEPVLPPGRTFANVLSGVDELVFTTFVPGYFFGSTNYDIGVDNVFIEPLAGGCAADFNGDNQADFFDYLDFVQAFDSEDPAADFNGDSQVDFFDYLDFATAFDAGC